MRNFAHQARVSEGNRGFTLIELLVVIGIILFLMSISVALIANMASRAREAATASTILKIDRMLQQRIEAIDRGMEKRRRSSEMRQRRFLAEQILESQTGIANPGPELVDIFVKKNWIRNELPQHPFDTFDGSVHPIWSEMIAQEEYSGPTDPRTVSAAILYHVLTRHSAIGTETVDIDAFLSSEVADTDGDGLLEFVDAWGNPLQYYRWPTRLIRPHLFFEDNPMIPSDRQSSRIDRNVSSLMTQGDATPNHRPYDPLVEPELFLKTSYRLIDPLAEDPDDFMGRVPIMNIHVLFPQFESWYHTPYTWHRPLIVSAGADGELGLFYPTDIQRFGHLAQPDLESYSYEEVLDRLSGNITNRNARSGGR